LAWATGLPLVGVDHLLGHLSAAFLRRSEASVVAPPELPFVALLASGGHTAIYRVDDLRTDAVRELGATRDDAAGEAFDKIAKLLGLGYPGGPIVDQLAKEGDASKIPLPLPMAHSRSLEMSFSGIKTQVAALARTPMTDERRADICASFQMSVTSVLTKKLLLAAQRERVETVVLGGGVAANSELRTRTLAFAKAHGLRAVLPELASCTDNAAMIAYAGVSRLRRGEHDGWGLVATSTTALPRATRKGRGVR
jgi:N6-L-threonylcarbamoyladenine synthase